MKKKQIDNSSDIAREEDLFFAVMNLISIEEHLAFTAMKTGKKEYLHALDSIRELRKLLLKKLLRNTEGELWCVSKHLISSTMRLMETGARYLGNDTNEAENYYKAAFNLYTIFWFLQKLKENVKHVKESRKKSR